VRTAYAARFTRRGADPRPQKVSLSAGHSPVRPWSLILSLGSTLGQWAAQAAFCAECKPGATGDWCA
jgi:hypothetical protein